VARDWPIMKIGFWGYAREYTFDAADQIEDKATFDEQGKANSHAISCVSLTLWKAIMLFSRQYAFTVAH